jgi:glyoxylase-like metal-dependent hydrolase (beta-lactamase superfamily II)
VTVHALSAGFLTLPEHLFVQPCVEGARNTVPSLAFLIQHYDTKTSKLERILFDLGLRKDLKQYPVPLQEYLESRQPLVTEPDVSDSLAAGGLKPDDIDYVILSHVHWDHVGMPSDFKSSQFIVGSGSLALLELGRNPLPAESNSYFEADLLPVEMTTELPGVHQVTDAEVGKEVRFDALTCRWMLRSLWLRSTLLLCLRNTFLLTAVLSSQLNFCSGMRNQPWSCDGFLRAP